MILTTNGFMQLNPYGNAIKIPRGKVTIAYTILAIIIPIIVPVFLAPIIYKKLPSHWRFGQ